MDWFLSESGVLNEVSAGAANCNAPPQGACTECGRPSSAVGAPECPFGGSDGTDKCVDDGWCFVDGIVVF